jgi:GxxExxY protein|tara:strand:- start:106 stop:486 length:381 start_codon:yes stop_codon:yes gene_type:complete
MKKEDSISKDIIRCAIEVHKTLGGPGLLESVYEEALAYELEQSHQVTRQMEQPIIYKSQKIGNSLRIDLIVDDVVIVECKATSEHNTLFESQVLTYLRLSKLKLGLVLNFGQRYVKDGIHRVVNGL